MNPIRAFSVILILVLTGGLPAEGAAAPAFDTAAEHAILMDYETGTVLFEKAADAPTGPASMSKMMTVYIVFERIKEGSLSLEDKMTVSVNAWRKGGAATGGSTMFLEPNTQVTVAELLRGVIVQSGNDASIVLAEGIAGSESLFTQLMNETAEELGLTNSIFKNATGLPHADQHVSGRDLAILARATIRDFPDLYTLYAEESFTYNGIKQRNRNTLLFRNIGVDGLKTGHTEESGYGLAASASRDGRRLIAVVHGLDSEKSRIAATQRLLEYGFLNFDNYALFSAGEEVGDINVWLGTQPAVPMVVREDVSLALSRAERRGMKVTAIYDEPIPAPVEQGDRIGQIRITFPERDAVEVPLFAAATSRQLGPIEKVGAAIEYLIFGASASVPARP